MSLNVQSLNLYLNQQKELFGDILYLDDKDQIGLDSFYKLLNNCQNCLGSPNSDYVIVSHKSDSKNKENHSLIEEADKLLAKILLAISLSKETVFVSNIIKNTPQNKKNIKIEEIEECRKHLDLQLKLIKPKVIIVLGHISANLLLNNELSLQEMRSRTFKYYNIDLKVTFHPFELIENSNLKKTCWDDFKYIKRKYIDS